MLLRSDIIIVAIVIESCLRQYREGRNDGNPVLAPSEMPAPPGATAETLIATAAPAPAPTPPLIPAPTTRTPPEEAALQQLIPEENGEDWDDPMDILYNPYFGRGPSFTFEEDQYPNIIFYDGQDSRGYFETLEDYDDTKIDMDDDDPNAVWEDTSLSRPLTDWYLPVGEWRDPWSGLMDQF